MHARSSLVIAAAAFLIGACDDSNSVRRVVGDLASDRIELTVEANEPIIEIHVAEGEAVIAGQLLLRQDATRVMARLAEAIAALAQAQARLDELVRGPRQEQIAAARAYVHGAIRDLEFRGAEYERTKRIHEQQLASPDLLDRAKAALDAAQANHDLRRAQLQELLAGTTVEELTQAEQALRQAEARRDYLQVDVERHEVRAPVAGIVDSRLFEPGERPASGQPVLILLGGVQPYARVYVPEAIRVNIGPGTAARIFVDGLEEVLDGRVRWVSSESAFTPYYALTERDRGRLSYLAKIDLIGPRDRLPDGVPVEVEFLSDSRVP
jgi:HlyD family secretion protein